MKRLTFAGLDPPVPPRPQRPGWKELISWISRVPLQKERVRDGRKARITQTMRVGVETHHRPLLHASLPRCGRAPIAEPYRERCGRRGHVARPFRIGAGYFQEGLGRFSPNDRPWKSITAPQFPKRASLLVIFHAPRRLGGDAEGPEAF